MKALFHPQNKYHDEISFGLILLCLESNFLYTFYLMTLNSPW